MDAIYLLLIYVSMLVYLGSPVFWIIRHYIYINYKTDQMKLRLAAYGAMLVFDVLAYFALSPYITWANPVPQLAATFGWVLLALWLVVEAWSRALITFKQKKSAPITSGPYALVRHPMYLNGLVFNFAAYLVTGSYIPLAVFVEWIILIKPLADMEDEELALRMEEDYLKYRKKVPQLLPKMVE